MKKVDKILHEYYEDKRRQNKLEYEINILKNSNNNMQKYLECNPKFEGIKARIAKNEQMIMNKQLSVNDIKINTAALEFIISSLSCNDKSLIELKYKNRKEYKEIIAELNISKSTISRKLNLINNLLESQLCV